MNRVLAVIAVLSILCLGYVGGSQAECRCQGLQPPHGGK